MPQRSNALHGRSDVSVADLVSAGLLTVGEVLRFGAFENTTVVTETGLRIDDREFRSPSMAANFARGSNHNGWTAWRATRDGRQVRLTQLRDEYRARQR